MGHIQDKSYVSARTGKKVPRYQARASIGAGRHLTKRFTTKRDANNWILATESKVQSGDVPDWRGGREALSTFSTNWLRRQTLARGTHDRYESALRTHIVPALGSRPINRIRPSDVETFIATLGKQGMAASTIETTVGVLSRILKAAVRDRLVPFNACDSVRLPRVTKESKVALTPDEVRRIAEALEHQFRTLLLLGAATGMRQGEICGLTIASVDFDLGLIRVEEQLLTPNRGQPYRGALKTAASKRTVALPTFLEGDLRDLTERRLAETGDDTSLLFVLASRNPIRRSRLCEKVRVAAERAGIGRKVTTHDLRRGFASMLNNEGRDIVEISLALGHSNIRQTMQAYLLPMAGSEAKRMRSIDGIVSTQLGRSRPKSD